MNRPFINWPQHTPIETPRDQCRRLARQGYKNLEIAEMTGIPYRKVQEMLRNYRKQLREAV